MKTVNQVLFATVLATGLSLTIQAGAQPNLNPDDGIAASPRLRQMLNERKPSTVSSAVAPRHAATATVASTGGRTVGERGIAASPKMTELLNDQVKRSEPGSDAGGFATTGYQATGQDGISASPKLRQQLDERTETFMVAPVK